MKLFLLCAFVACASGTELQNKPKFTWLHDQTSEFGVPLLQINFPDNGEVDYALLEPYNPIPKRSYEREEDVDNCIFQGKLQNEPNVHVTVTGGCPRDEIFEIQFRSKRLSDHLFRMKNGEVEILKSPLSDRSLEFVVQDVAEGLLETADKTDVSDRVPLPPALVMNVGAYYEQTFKARFQADSVNTMRRVLAQAQNIYYWPTLTTRIRMNVVVEMELNMVLEADGGNLTYALTVGADRPNLHTNVIMCSQNNQYGVVGIGWLGTVCSSNYGYRSNINEYFFTDSQTGQIVAHEIGHNLGMSHDFTTSGGARFDSQNRPCTNIGGIMDYNQPTFSVWSTCSVEDFTAYYNLFASFCMPIDSSPTSSTPSVPTTSYIPTTSGPDGNWGDWTDYTTCSATCGTGQVIRWRQCNNPPPMPTGQPCSGCNAAYFSCNTQPCTSTITLTLEVQDVLSGTFLHTATLNVNGQATVPPAVYNNVLNGTVYNVGATNNGYIDVPVRQVTPMAIGSASAGGSLQYLTLMVPNLLPSQLAIVLGWGPGISDLDLHVVQFPVGSPSSYCHLYYANRACDSTTHVRDWLSTGSLGGEMAHVTSNATSFIYGVFVRSGNIGVSQAEVSVFGLSTPLSIRASSTGSEYIWVVGCLNGATRNAAAIDSYSYDDPTTTLAATCASLV